MDAFSKEELIGKALDARRESYSPYSGFAVGAAILTDSGKVYSGANIENASFGATICAERTAAVKAISEGERKFRAIAIAGSPSSAEDISFQYSFPCGICRQFLREFALPGMKVYIKGPLDDIYETTLDELLPHSFGPENLS